MELESLARDSIYHNINYRNNKSTIIAIIKFNAFKNYR